MASPPTTSKTTKVMPASSQLLLTFCFFFALNHAHAHLPSASSSTPRRFSGFSVLLTGPAGFVGPHCTMALKDRGQGTLGLANFNDYHHPSRPALWSKHPVFIVEGDLHDAHLFCKLFQTVPLTHTLHHRAAAQSKTDGFLNLLNIANPSDPQPAVLQASSSSISGRTISGINPKDHSTMTTRGLISQADHGTALKKRVQERARFVRSIDSKLVAKGGAGAFHGEGRMNVEKEKCYKQFPQMHRLGRRLLHSSKGWLVVVSRASGPVTPSGPSHCTHIPKGKGHC